MSLELFFDEHIATHGPKLGINGISDLLLYLPKKYNDYSRLDDSYEQVARDNRRGLFRVRVNKVFFDYKKKPARVTAYLTDGNNEISASKFGAIQSWKGINKGAVIHVQGKVNTYNGKWQIQDADVIPEFKIGRVFPEYKGVKGALSHEHIATCITKAVSEHIDIAQAYILDYLGIDEAQVLAGAIPDFASIPHLIRAIHFPDSMSQAEAALRGAARLNVYAVMQAASRVGKKVFAEASMIPVDYTRIKALVDQLPFPLTRDQKLCVWDICKDLQSPYTMDRVISGDVGCGKTMAYGIPSAYANLLGKRVIIISPNMMLAQQIHEEITTTFPDVNAVLAIDGNPINALDKEMIIGTTYILGVLKRNPQYTPDLVIVDEQQKFSEEQKLSLLHDHSNLLQASATPIPKTMGEIVFGNKAVSYIEEPPVKKTIHSFVVTARDKPRVMEHLMKIVARNKQISVLYPLREYKKRLFQFSVSTLDNFDDIKKQIQKAKGKRVSKPEGGPEGTPHYATFTLDAAIAEAALSKISQIQGIDTLSERPDPEAERSHQKTVEDAARLWEERLPGRVVSVHGGMDMERKLAAVTQAKSGGCDAIITSSVIEIGLTFPDLMGMLVVDADKYGASTLHQIRGRLARKGGVGYFFMFVDKERQDISEETMSRLNILTNSTKGSDVAYNDMMQRGFGDLASEEGLQSGHLHSIFRGIKIRPEDILALAELQQK